MVGTIQQYAIAKFGIENLPMDKKIDLPTTKVLVEIEHPLCVWKSELTGMLKVANFTTIRPYFKLQIFPHLAFEKTKDYTYTKKFNERETQVIFALLVQQGKLTQQRINDYYEDSPIKLDALTETIIKKTIIPLIEK